MDIREWKGSTAKLYLALLTNPGQRGTQTALMERMGTSDKATFLAARRQLEEVGLAYREGGVVFLTEQEKPTQPGVQSLPRVEIPTWESLPVMANPTANMTATVGIPTTSESDTPRTRCVQADRIGERAKQVEALHFAFGKRFPGKNQPNDESIRILLRLTGDSAEAVDEAFESAAVRGPESPWSYVRAVLTRQKEAKPVAAPALDNDDLPPAPPEMVAEWKRGEAVMKRLGLLPREEDL